AEHEGTHDGNRSSGQAETECAHDAEGRGRAGVAVADVRRSARRGGGADADDAETRLCPGRTLESGRLGRHWPDQCWADVGLAETEDGDGVSGLGSGLLGSSWLD